MGGRLGSGSLYGSYRNQQQQLLAAADAAGKHC